MAWASLPGQALERLAWPWHSTHRIKPGPLAGRERAPPRPTRSRRRPFRQWPTRRTPESTPPNDLDSQDLTDCSSHLPQGANCKPLPQPLVDSGAMADVPLDTQERHQLCDLLDELGPSVPTLLEGWTAHDLAAHIVLRERDLVAGPCLVLPGAFQRFAERRRARLAESKDFAWLVARIRSGPPIGFFRVGWVRSFPSLNEFFVHHEDVRRANRNEPRSLTPAMDVALWRNVRRGSHYLSRRLHASGLEIEWAGTDERVTVRRGEPTARLSGPPGELLLYVFGRQAAAQVEMSGSSEAVAAVRRTHFGM